MEVSKNKLVLFISSLMVLFLVFFPQSAYAGFRLMLNDPDFIIWLFVEVTVTASIIITIWEGAVFYNILGLKLSKAKFLMYFLRVNIISFYISIFCACLVGILAGTAAEEVDSNIIYWGITIYMIGFFSYVSTYRKINFFNKISQNLPAKKLRITAIITSIISHSALLAFLYYELI